MISRLRLLDYQSSRGPGLVGSCASDTSGCAAMVNAVEERLLTCREVGEHGWWGCYGEMVFSVDPTVPYITMPRGVARIISADACRCPIPLRNQFYEYLSFGSGRWPKVNCNGTSNASFEERQLLRRNRVPTMTDLTVPGYGLRIYAEEIEDYGKHVLVSCVSATGQIITTDESNLFANGVYVTLAQGGASLILPNTTAMLEISAITGIQKDQTIGAVSIYQSNLTTSLETLLLRMEPGETVAGYERYYLSGMPSGCCVDPANTANKEVIAMVKFDRVPVRVSTDYLLIQSLEAIIEEAQAIRKAGTDSADGKQQAMLHHRDAIRFLQGQLVHYEGKEGASVQFAPFGSARLRNQRIGAMI